jgi:hypothetical protein
MVIYPTYSEECVRDCISISLHSWGILGLSPHCRYFRPKTVNKTGCWSTCSFQLSTSHSFCGSFKVNINKIGNVRINVILRRFHATTVAVQNQRVLLIVSLCEALVIQHVMCMRHIVIWGLPGSTEFFYIISYMVRLKEVTENKRVLWFSIQRLKHFSF